LLFNDLPACGDYDFVKIPDSFSAHEGGMDKMKGKKEGKSTGYGVAAQRIETVRNPDSFTGILTVFRGINGTLLGVTGPLRIIFSTAPS